MTEAVAERPKPTTLLRKGTLAQVFSCEFCEISKNTFFYRSLPMAAFVMRDGLKISTLVEKENQHTLKLVYLEIDLSNILESSGISFSEESKKSFQG